MKDDSLELFAYSEDEVHGKSVESLKFSRQKRREILNVFDGEIPTSIIKAKRGRQRSAPARGSYGKSEWHIQKGLDKSGPIPRIFGISGKGTARGALSQFPQNVGRMVLRLYSKPGDLVVDPFAGHNSRMELTVSEGRNYHGYDVSKRFMEFNRELADHLREEFKMEIRLYEQDSRLMSETEDSVGDFTLTSPPYWDIEFYGDEDEQLGKARSYRDFIKELGEVALQNYRVLKEDAFCVWFINDFRKNGVFYSFHSDVIRILVEAGFKLWDLLVVDLGVPIRAAFATQVVEQKILPKRHEFGVIARKV